MTSITTKTGDIKANNPMIDKMFKAGAHFGFSRTRRHPTIAPYIFGVKNKVEIFDHIYKKWILLSEDDVINFSDEIHKIKTYLA